MEPGLRQRRWRSRLARGLSFTETEDGNQFPIEIMLSPLKSEDGVLVTAAIRDISERKQLERQLQQSQKMEAVGQLTAELLTISTIFSP